MKLTARRITAIGGLAAVASLGLMVRSADAHHPEIEASSSCADGLAEVRIRTYSWLSDVPGHRDNPDIAVRFDGAVIGRGAFTPSNDFEFTLVYRTPATGGTHLVRATAEAPFGPVGEYGSVGEYSETSVTIPTDCSHTAPVTEEPTTTTTAAPTTTVAPAPTTTAVPPTTEAPSTTAAPATTVPVVVGGVTETPGGVEPVVVLPRFAG